MKVFKSIGLEDSRPKSKSPQYIALRRYERRWLPALSIANIFGVILFITYIGSAVQSAFTPNSSHGGTFARAKEIAACRALPPLSSSCLGRGEQAINGTRRTLYMQPYGALGSRLRAVASALTLGKEVGANVVIVWNDREHGYAGAWNELFAQPALPLGCFPGNSWGKETALCKVHTVNHYNDWEEVASSGWEHKTDPDGAGHEVLCLKSVMYLTEKQNGIEWFYKLLQPAASIKSRVDAFIETYGFGAAGTAWVGVHARRTDLKLKCKTDDCKDGVSVEEALPLSRFTQVMKEVGDLTPESPPMFFLATDDPEAEALMRKEMNSWIARNNIDSTPNELGAGGEGGGSKILGEVEEKGRVVSLPKITRDTSGGWLEMRSAVSGLQEAVADLYLLSRCHVLVGTVGSTFSQTARLMGNAFFLTVGVEYENRM